MSIEAKQTPTDPHYKAGYDAGKNGENTTNCHYSHFASKRIMQQWQAGYDAAKRERSEPQSKP